ncbi:13700_t:CDS:10 [Acaulospora morrowiae]|uniref:Glutamate pyruvate transaminase n=1 Tax=Acaulospora morrowiae TaxID=94023 RepID=A0A9N8WNC7_9GLOM|nr:13700_t:CDS:10 [Acaulospora morrowiae]
MQATTGFFGSESPRSKILTYDSINPHVKKVEYAVRGELAIRAEEIKERLGKKEDLGFDAVVGCNIGNPQQLLQRPITFFRQVASLTEYPDLLLPENKEHVKALYPPDAIERARTLLKQVGSVGAYSHSQGIPHIRQDVAKFIEERDGYPSNKDEIFLTQGASPGVQSVLQLIVTHPNVGIMIPIPQYPLYSATLSLFDSHAVPYYLNEEDDWGLDIDMLTSSLTDGRVKGLEVRALVIINPGNPTGQCLTERNMREIIEFCYKERIVLLADEVYQTNIYQPAERPFHSFKKVLKSMGSKYDQFELFSFHSISKGMIGECGRRGGYYECTGIDKEVVDQLYKLASVSLCPNVQGQIMVDLMVKPPKRGEPSYELYQKEIRGIYESLKRRSKKLSNLFNSLEGVTCNNAQGSMYLFPRIRLPRKAIEAASEAGKKPDVFYCLAMLNATGVCVVPGSGFGQKDGTWHFRSTFLPPEELFDGFCARLKKFHQEFLSKYFELLDRRSVADIFRIQVISNTDVRSPIITLGSTSFFHVRHENLYIVAVTKCNANAALVFEFCYRLINIGKVYFGKLDEEAVKNNFVLVYELLDGEHSYILHPECCLKKVYLRKHGNYHNIVTLDYFDDNITTIFYSNNLMLTSPFLEVLDFGYPQNSETETLKLYITTEGVKSERALKEDSSKITIQATGATAWRRSDVKYRKNEAFIDVIESVNLLMSTKGTVLRADVSGQIMMRAYLSGTPECKFGLNDKLLLEKDSAHRGTSKSNSSQRRTNAVEIDDCQFHQCVKLGKFDSDRTISFVPPDGEFELMRYRTTENVNLPFRVHPVVNEVGKSRVEYRIAVKANFSQKLYANNVLIRIPTPLNTANINLRVASGKAKYVPAENSIVWKIPRFQGQTEVTLSGDAELSAMIIKKAWSRPPISMDFQVLMFTSSGLLVRFLKVFEKSDYTSVKWVRYMTKAGSYQIRKKMYKDVSQDEDEKHAKPGGLMRYLYCGGRASCGKTCGILCCFLFLIIVGIVAAVLLWARPPEVTFLGIEPSSTAPYVTRPSGFDFNFNLKIQVNNPNIVGATFSMIKAVAFYPKHQNPIGGGNLTNVDIASKANTTIFFPFSINYNANLDPEYTILVDIAKKCGIIGNNKTKLEIDYTLTLSLKVILITVSPSFNKIAFFDCPIKDGKMPEIPGFNISQASKDLGGKKVKKRSLLTPMYPLL